MKMVFKKSSLDIRLQDGWELSKTRLRNID